MTNSISWDHDDTIHAYWAVPGSVLVGEYPGGPQGGAPADALSALLDSGIRTFIDVTHPSERLPPYGPTLLGLCEQSGIDVAVLSFPIPAEGVLDMDGYDAIVDQIRSSVGLGGVYVHGRVGLERSAVVMGCMLIDSGLSYEGAMRTIKERRSGTRLADTRDPNSFPQREILIRRADRPHADNPAR